MLHKFEIDMVAIDKQAITDTWLTADWDEYIKNVEHSASKEAKGYYHNNKYRIEAAPISNEHSQDHCLIGNAVLLYATLKGIPLMGKNNCSYRQAGLREFQPDLSCYIGENANAIPWGVGIVNLNDYLAPDLVIEISNTSLSDDLGEKRLLYEEVQVAEYWVIDVKNVNIIAFAIPKGSRSVIADGGSRRITESRVLTGLKLEILPEALKRSRNTNHTEVASWLMQQFHS